MNQQYFNHTPMKTLIYLTLSIVFILPLKLNAQQNKDFCLEGTLCDIATGKAVDYATVAILSAPDSLYVKGAVSNENGKFRINNLSSKKYIVSVSHLLYKRKFINLNLQENHSLGTVNLESNVKELNAVVVTANTIQHKADRYVISLQNNPITKGNNTTELLGLMPGVTNERGDLKIYGRNVSKIYIDGRKIKNKSELDATQAENLDKVEIVYMTGSSEDASNMGGVINIKLKKPVNGGYYGSLSGNFSTLTEDGHNADNINSSFSYRYKKLSVYNYISYDDSKNTNKYDINSHYKDIDRFIKMKTHEGGWNHSFTDRLSLTYDINTKHSIGTDFRISIQNGTPVQGSESSVMNDQKAIIDQTNSSIQKNLRNRQYQGAFNYKWLIDKKGSNFKLIADYLRYNNKIKQNSAYLYERYTENEYARYSFNDIDDKTDMFEADAKFEIKSDKNGQFDFGLNYSLYKSAQWLKYRDLTNGEWIENKELSDRYKLEGNNYAGYISYSSVIKQRLMYKIGMRVQENKIKYNSLKVNKENSKSYSGLYPSVNLMYNIDPAKGTMLNLAYQRVMNPIPYNVITPVVVYNDENSYTKGNVDISPANYHMIMLGSTIENKWNLNYIFITGKDILYYKTFVDENNSMITYTMPISEGKMTGHGFGIDRTFKLIKWWRLKANARMEWIQYEREVDKTSTWKPNFLLINNFNFNNGWGGNLTGYLEPTYKTQERTYKSVYGIYGKIYRYLLKNKLLIDLNFTAYAHNRQLITETQYLLSKRTYKTCQTAFIIGATYNFNGGKKVNAKQAKSIQNYYEYKDNY